MGSPKNSIKGQVLRKTQSPCPVCNERLEATIYRAGQKVRMRKHCPEHGDLDLVVSNDADFYTQLMELSGEPQSNIERAKEFSNFGAVRGICLDITQRCNLTCANCFAQANVKMKPDLPYERVVEMIDKISGRAPVVFLQGGEPTIHDDLFRIIRLLADRGCVVKLVTNGIALSEKDIVKKLKDAGLEWVFLQFDGFEDRVYEAFRGRKLYKQKMEALENLSDQKLSILLAVMIERDYNLDQVGRIIRFAFDQPHVRQISFMPGSRIGRNSLTDDVSRTEPVDVIDRMDTETKGGVTRKDFLSFFKIARTLNKVTGNPDYKPKSCFLPMILYRKNGRIFGLNRVLDPGFVLSHPGAVGSSLNLAGNIRRLDHAHKDPDTLWLCIEHFRELATLDINDALHCNKVFLDGQGQFVRGCIYNNLYRQ